MSYGKVRLATDHHTFEEKSSSNFKNTQFSMRDMREQCLKNVFYDCGVHTFSTSPWETVAGRSEFQATLVSSKFHSGTV